MEDPHVPDPFQMAVQKEVEKRMTELRKDFAVEMEKAIKNGLEGINQLNAALMVSRKEIDDELNEIKRTRVIAEKEGEKMAREYLEQSRSKLVAFTQTEQLRQLTSSHLAAGKSVKEICFWLQVDKTFVESIEDMFNRNRHARHSLEKNIKMTLAGNPKIRYENKGRSGTVWFENDQTKFDMWWEFGGGDVLAIINIPSRKNWEKRTNLPLEQRENILHFIGEQVVRDQTSGNHQFEIGDDFLTIRS